MDWWYSNDASGLRVMDRKLSKIGWWGQRMGGVFMEMFRFGHAASVERERKMEEIWDNEMGPVWFDAECVCCNRSFYDCAILDVDFEFGTIKSDIIDFFFVLD